MNPNNTEPKSAESWRVEHWASDEYIITGFGWQHPGTFRKGDATSLCNLLKLATPIIQLDATNAALRKAAELVSRRQYPMEMRTCGNDAAAILSLLQPEK